ncbi:hypothetical protein F4819DRAFT_107583 [Hypoxylon fuscum]|nr:hypothetical protein F4819DRAFT_107583 [Hypoxylon fuscum]
MADARALLRAHRTENRIKHPHAAYSDAGKLLCKLCHELVKSDALWEGHVRGPDHRKRLQSSPPSQPQPVDDGNSKRKHDCVEETTSDADEDGEDDDDPVGAVRKKKRSKTEIVPPTLGRRTSSTPIQGVEIAIPSRPATPAAASNSATSTPKAAPVGRSPLVGSDTANAPSTRTSLPISTQSLAVPASTTTPNAANGAVDEAEWAAFEAEMAATADDETTGHYSADATVSAPAMTAEQIAAKSQEEENERRKHLLDAQIADEREDATRALEAEFEEMEELEGRVRRLKERRDELRKGSVANLRAAAGHVVMAKDSPAGADGKENNNGMNEDKEEEEEEEEEDEEEDDDDWGTFRFR